MKIIRHVVPAVAAVAIALGAYLSLAAPTQAPSVAYTLLDGTVGNTDQLRGKVVLVNFWATSCVTCMAEMPNIVSTHEKFKAKGYETLSVAMSYDPPSYVVNYARTRKLPFGVAIDNTGVIAREFGDVALTPTSVLINKRGEIVKRYVGEPDFVALDKLVTRLLAET
jgi:peroxiredoxin